MLKMRIGIVNSLKNIPYYMQIWETILHNVSEPIDWVPESYWKDHNLSNFDAILTGKVDSTTEMWNMIDVRIARVNFTLPIRTRDLALRVTDDLQPRHKFVTLLLPTSILSVLSPGFWAVLGTMFMCLLISSCNGHTGGWPWFGHFTMQNTMSTQNLTSRLLLVLTGVFTLHSLSLYQGGLLTQLVYQPKYSPTVHSLEQVIHLITTNQAVINLARPSSSIAQMMQDATEPDDVWYKLKLATRKNPVVYAENYYPEDSSQRVITVASYMELLDQSTLTNCKFVLMPLNIHSYEAFMLSPNVTHKTMAEMNDAIVQRSQLINMFFEQVKEDEIRKYDVCRNELFKKHSMSVGDPIELWRLGEAFVLLGYGLILCVVTFVVESVI